MGCCGGDAPGIQFHAMDAVRPVGQRHMLYHILPRRGPFIWQLNVQRLLSRIELFDGVRSIAIATDHNCDDAAAVREAFRGHRVDNWIVVPNNPSLREVATWKPLWESVQGREGAVWYGHAKGVMRPINRGTTIHRWTRLLYAANLDYWPIVARLLGSFAVAGALKKVGHGFRGSKSTWHYSGSFFWGRLDKIGHRWRAIDSIWFGVESWPGIHFPPAQAGIIFGTGGVPELDMYAMRRFTQEEAKFFAWTREQLHAG